MTSDRELIQKTHDISIRLEQQLISVNKHLVIINNRLNDHGGRIRTVETEQGRHLSDTEHLEEAIRKHEKEHPSAIRLILLLVAIMTLLNGGAVAVVYKIMEGNLGG